MHLHPHKLALILGLCCLGVQGITQEPDTSGTDEERVKSQLEKELYKSTIDSMASQAGYWHDLEEKVFSGKLDTLDGETIEREMKAVDSSNLVTLKTLFTLYGFPGINEYGRKTSRDFTYLLQRAVEDPKFQEKALLAMKELVDSRNASPQDYAYLTDLVRLNTGRKQLYGTQLSLGPDGNALVPKPIEAPGLIDQRRSEIGLGPFEEYLGKMNERYGFK